MGQKGWKGDPGGPKGWKGDPGGKKGNPGYLESGGVEKGVQGV